MTLRSQNGWSVITPAKAPFMLKTLRIGSSTKISLRRNFYVQWFFKDLLTYIDENVVNIDKHKDDWGYAYRAIRGQTSGYSNHASGTAVDIDASEHPLGKVGTWTPEQERKIQWKLRSLHNVIRWGGNYHNRKDEMHFEIDAPLWKLKEVYQQLKKERS